ncbi:hypothetical protein ACLOJK_028744 [Asimina triloba]
MERIDLVGQGPASLSEKAYESLARQDEENLQAGLALSHKEACRSDLFGSSLEASVDLVFLKSTLSKSTPLPVLVRDIEGDTTSPNHVLELEIFEVLSRDGVGMNGVGVQGSLPRCDVDPSGTKAPVHRGVLGYTFRDALSCPYRDLVFRWPFDMEARAMKILGDLLPIKSRGIRECHALGLASILDD